MKNKAVNRNLVDISKLVRASTFGALYMKKYRPGTEAYTRQSVSGWIKSGKIKAEFLVTIDNTQFIHTDALEINLAEE